MEKSHNNYTKKSLPPLSHRLKSNIEKYKRFTEDPDLRSTFTPQFIESFFDFLERVAEETDTKKQLSLLEDPTEFGYKAEFGLYMTISEVFLETYGNDIQSSKAKSWFEQYTDIIFQSEINHIKQTKRDIKEALDPNSIYETYHTYLSKYGISFENQLDYIGEQIGFDTTALGSDNSMSINIIKDLYYDNNNISKDEKEKGLSSELIRPFLLNNIHICQNYIYQQNQRETSEEKKQ